ncbi:MAG: hypothetical protein ACOZAI_07825 [Pseudomonadota bacterium]
MFKACFTLSYRVLTANKAFLGAERPRSDGRIKIGGTTLTPPASRRGDWGVEYVPGAGQGGVLANMLAADGQHDAAKALLAAEQAAIAARKPDLKIAA